MLGHKMYQQVKEDVKNMPKYDLWPLRNYKPELSNRRVSGQYLEYLEVTWDTYNNPYFKQEITREIRKYFELNENEITTSDNMQLSNNWRDFFVLNAYIRKSVLKWWSKLLPKGLYCKMGILNAKQAEGRK